MKKKKKIIIVVVSALALVLVGLFAFRMFAGRNAAIDNQPEAEVTGESKVLVAYFSWSGNVQQMAKWVSEETGGELFRIVPEVSYGDDYNDCADRAKEELDNKERPAISSHIDPNIMANYDVIYLGFPVWWYDLPMPVWTFLEEYDLQGKTIIPFFSHNGSSNGAGSLDTIADLADKSTVRNDDVLSIRGSDVLDSENEVIQWASEQLKK